ncbi:hypothetical protein [Microbulbifer magnicolonia]|uniref:hypothetical protein n=1 Tax=Microbulbifer magnicolonia TaxID=3109744 RepID=UPI002B40A3CA|nr:hypothetical protein [Microbulbifer sp. GG15]
MIWVAIIIGIILIFIFPKQMGVLGAVVVGGMGAIYLYLQVDENSKRRDLEAVSIVVKYDTSICSEEYPIAINFKNGSRKVVENIKWNIGAYRPGYSDNIVNYGSYGGEYSTPYESHKILAPNQTFGVCYKAPSLKLGVSPNTVNWSIVNKYVGFAQ